MAKLGLILQDALFHERYRVVRCIKAGGMGAVYEVLDERTNSRRALKAMLPGAVDDTDLRARFEQEARITGKIESDHIVRVSDAGIDDATGTPFMVMELLRGRDLGHVVEKGAPLSREDVVLYLTQTALALDKTHAAGVVHRDLKPENLFVTTRDDGSRCLKILDFGIAKVLERRTHAKSTRTIGTPTYMAPEQIRGSATIGPAADIYALGHIGYALLVGVDYWTEEASQTSSTFAFFSRVLLGMSEEPSTRARRMRGIELPAAFDVWLFRAAAAHPDDRYASASACIVALADALDVPTPPALAHVPLPDPVIARVSSAPTVSHSAPTLAEPTGPINVLRAPKITDAEGAVTRVEPAFRRAPEQRAPEQRAPERTPEPDFVRDPEAEIALPLTRRGPAFILAGAALVGMFVAWGALHAASAPRAKPSPGIDTAPSSTGSGVPRVQNTSPAPSIPPSAEPSAIASAMPPTSSTAAPSPSARPAAPRPRPPPKPQAAPNPSSQPHGLM